jgi:DNA repair exonuclease SbcCD ATPase subunit
MDNTHRNNVNHVTSSITALNEKINKIDVTQLQYQIRNEDLTKQTSLQLDEITKLKNAISTLTQSVQEQATQITQLSTRLDSSNEHNKSLLNTFNTINNNSININNALHSLSQLTQNIKQHEVSIQNIQREFNTIKTTLTASNANNAVSSEFIAFKTESNAQLNVIHNKVNELSNIMDKQNKDINTQLYAITNSMNVLDSEYHSAETHLNKQLNDISTELTKQNTQINANATQIAMIYQRVNSVDQRNSYSGNSFIDKGVSYPVVDLNQLYAKVEVLNQKVPMLETQFHTFNQTQQSYNETLTLKVNQLERNKIIHIHNNNIPSAIGNEEYNTITESINILNDKIPLNINTLRSDKLRRFYKNRGITSLLFSQLSQLVQERILSNSINFAEYIPCAYLYYGIYVIASRYKLSTFS